jgi:two-component system OmpR family response regulator
MTMSLLLAEDDPVLGDGLARALQEEGFRIDWTRDGISAAEKLLQSTYAAVILDLGLPKRDGLDVLRQLRARRDTTPVLILTARDRLEDRVSGLNLGADDYLAKPFEITELVARLHAITRRQRDRWKETLELGRLRYDVSGQRAYVDDVPLDLSARETGLLHILATRAGRVVSKDQIVEHLLGHGEEVQPNTVEVYLHRVRRKLEGSGLVIRTVRGLGYILEKPRVG